MFELSRESPIPMAAAQNHLNFITIWSAVCHNPTIDENAGSSDKWQDNLFSTFWVMDVRQRMRENNWVILESRFGFGYLTLGYVICPVDPQVQGCTVRKSPLR